jgi:NADH:ubiquinone oxidoreductase subunit 5 (subunit L)/multisubunit Na+/H+ antiporter MnhA subunit
MRTTLLILAVLSVVAGYGHWFQALVVGPGAHHLAAVAEGHGGVLAVTAAHGAEGGALPLSLALLGGGLSTHSARQVVLSLSLVIGGLGIWLSWLVYFRGRILPEALARAMGPIHTLVAGKYFVDEAYQAALIRPCVRLAHLCRRFDTRVIDWVVDSVGHAGRAVAAAIGVYDKVFVDGMVNLVAHVSQLLGRALNLLQTGVIQNYLLKVAGAIAVLLLAWRLAHG